MEPTPAQNHHSTFQGSCAGDAISGRKESECSDFTILRVNDVPKFDLESYIANYSGRTRFSRLYFIGNCCSPLAVEALNMAILEARSGKDITNYQKAVGVLAAVAPLEAEATLDMVWVEQTLKNVKADTDRLEHELKGYKNNLIKESIRMGNEDLGQHYHEIGDLGAASKAYSRMREYCTTTSHIVSMLFNNINVAIDRRDWLSVQSNVYRLRNIQFKADDEAKSKAKMWASLGLSQLATGAYFSAAISFVSVDPILGDTYKQVISANDVTIYGGLCALASMDRTDLINHVLENKSFRSFLELEPHIRRAISFFCGSKFRPCLDILESYRTDYLLDIYLQKHVYRLYEHIRNKAIQQYVIPFSRITLPAMATTFSSDEIMTSTDDVKETESPFVTELLTLIQDGVLDARVDLEKRVLVTKRPNIHLEKHSTALLMVTDYLDNAHVQLLRLNLLHSGLEVPESQVCGPRAETLGVSGLEREEAPGDFAWKAFTSKFHMDSRGNR